METVIKIDVEKSYLNVAHDTEHISSILLDLYGSFDLVKDDHTLFKNSDEFINYLEFENRNVVMYVSNFSSVFLKDSLNCLVWKFI